MKNQITCFAQVSILAIALPPDAVPLHPLVSAFRDEVLVALLGATSCRCLCKCYGVTMQYGVFFVVKQHYKENLSDFMLKQPGELKQSCKVCGLVRDVWSHAGGCFMCDC